ncbi:MAG: uroporphyrinogen-III C-methyltransferase [Planctomycetia bacterium]|nr:uroporphyrinogen-III C-methyltransferase [Planctomycetia bacterium]
MDTAVPPPGRVSFVGAGPGAPDLLTVRALERLRRADVVVHDALVPARLLDVVNPAAERIAVDREDRSEGDPGTATGMLLVRLATQGRTVVRLKGGDPAVFARLAEELEPLRQAGIVVELVPGVTAALAAAAAAGLPLTSRDAASSLTIVTGREADDKTSGLDFGPLAALPGTISVYMGVEQVARWSRSLLAAGRRGDEPVTIVSRCSWPDQRIGTTTLADCAAGFARHGWRSPAVVIVGAGAAPPQRHGPLGGGRVLVVRPAGQHDEVESLVREAGGECVHVPVIAITDPPSWQPLDEAIDRADRYDWIVFASVNGVRSFLRRLHALGRDARALGTARLAAIGPATRRELEQSGLVCDLMPGSFRSEGLAAALAASLRQGRFLLVRADKGRDVLRRDLEALGHHVDEVAAYCSRPLDALDADVLAMLEDLPVDWIVLTSSSIAEAAARLFGARMRQWRIASISPVTTAAIVNSGLKPAVEAGQATVEGLVAAMAGWHVGMAGATQAVESTKPADATPPGGG